MKEVYEGLAWKYVSCARVLVSGFIPINKRRSGVPVIKVFTS